MSEPRPFPVIGAAGWLPPGDDVNVFIGFEQPPTMDPSRLLRGVPKVFGKRGKTLEGGLVLLRAQKAASAVAKHYGSTGPAQLDPETQAEFDTLSPKLRAAAQAAMNAYGDPKPWIAFRKATTDWVAQLHGRAPVAWMMRSVLPAEREAPLDEQDISGLRAWAKHAQALASSAAQGGRGSPAHRCIETAALFFGAAPELTELFVPALPHAFGIDEVGAAARTILFRLAPEGRRAFLDAQPSLAAAQLVLRTDLLPSFLEQPDAADVVRGVLERFVGDEHGLEAKGQLAFRLVYALHPVATGPAEVQAVVSDFLREHGHLDGAGARFAQVVGSLRNAGHEAMADAASAAAG